MREPYKSFGIEKGSENGPESRTKLFEQETRQTNREEKLKDENEPGKGPESTGIRVKDDSREVVGDGYVVGEFRQFLRRTKREREGFNIKANHLTSPHRQELQLHPSLHPSPGRSIL